MTIRVRLCPRARLRPSRPSLLAACTLAACLAVASPPGAAAMPQEEAELLRQIRAMSNNEVVRRLGESGLTRAEVRDRLRNAGYDPYLADEYFDALTRRSEVPGEVGMESLDALQRIGLIGDGLGDALAANLARPPLEDEATASEEDSLAMELGPPVFGKGVFYYQTPRFDPFLSGPVGDDYVLGPGDAISLVLTGDLERLYERLNVSRSGEVFIPAVGLVPVQGRTLGEVRDMLYVRLGQVYSGIRREAGETTRFSVSLAVLRAIQVRVLGAVERPGAYQISSVGTFLEALYFAGGPTDEGTYRRLLLNRSGQEPVEIDLYPYLNSGNTSGDPRMQNGDVVFVPAVGKQATIQGPVRREAVFELKEGEGLHDLIRFAGGLLPEASLATANVSRILPPSQRSQGTERVVVDVPLNSVLSGDHIFDILAGDVVSVSPVSPIVRNTVTVSGGVHRPGVYELQPDMTVKEVLERAGGALPSVRMDRIRLLRVDPALGRYYMVSSQVGPDVALAENDLVEVFSYGSFIGEDSVAVVGRVRNPGRYALAAGMTVSDLILSAGGLLSNADPRVAEVVRMAGTDGRNEATSAHVSIASTFVGSELPSSGSENEVQDEVQDSDYPLQADDRVFVRVSTERRETGTVAVLGEVLRPGEYALLRTDERLSSLIARAGGLTAEANPTGLQLRRRGIFVGVDLSLDGTGGGTGSEDPVVHTGDTIVLPVLDNTVAVTGSVNFPSRTVYRPGLSVEDVLSAAGGATDDADLNRTSVFYPDGNRSTVQRFLGFRRYPALEPGSTVFVPLKEAEAGTNWAQALGTTATILQAVAVNILAIRSLTDQTTSNQDQNNNQDDQTPPAG